MYRHEMTERQVELKNVFNRHLLRAGWDLGGWDTLLESDTIDMRPEAVGTFFNGDVLLKIEFHAQDDYVKFSLQSSADDDGVHLRFGCTDRLDEVLSIVTGHQNILTRMEYMSLLQDVLEICPQMYVEAAGELLLVKFKS